MKNLSFNSKIMFGLILFTSLLPLSFVFIGNDMRLLMETPYRYFVLTMQAITLLVILITREKLHRNQMAGMAMLFMLILFAFTFDDSTISFLILKHYANSFLSWTTAIILFSKMAFHSDVSKNING